MNLEFDRELKQHARMIAGEAHVAQVDKGGMPYLNHVQRVANAAVTNLHWGDDIFTACYVTGLLHDVLEDSNVLKVTDLYTDFPCVIADAVVAITHAHNEPWVDYMDRVKANDIATIVKIADLRDNSDIDRAIRVRRCGSAKDYERLTKVLIPRYIAAIDFLT